MSTSNRAAAFSRASTGPSSVNVARSPSNCAARTPGRPVNGVARRRLGEVQLQAPGGPGLQAPDVVDHRQAPAADQADAVGDALDLAEHVRGEEHGLAAVARLAEDLVHLALDERVEAAGGLVEDDQLRAVHQRQDEADLLAVALRQRADGPLALHLQAGQQRVGVGRRLAAQGRHQLDVLGRGAVVVEVQLAGQVADAPAQRHAVAARVVAEHADRPGGRADEVEQQPDGRRLPGAVGPDEAEHLARCARRGRAPPAPGGARRTSSARGS